MRTLNIVSILVVSILTLTGMVSGIIDQDAINNIEDINNQANNIEDINSTENIEEDTDQPITFVEKFNNQTPEETVIPKPTETPGFGSILSMIVIISIVYVFRIRKTWRKKGHSKKTIKKDGLCG